MYKKAIILPFKESFEVNNSGAASLFVKQSLRKENLKNFIIYGSPCIIENKYQKIFFANNIQKRIFRNYNYIKYFIDNFIKINFESIEIHNRPEYVKFIKNAFPKSKIIFYFHNDPLTLRGSKSYDDRKYINENCDVIFLSKWIKNRFKVKDLKNNKNAVIYPGFKKNNKRIKHRKNIIFFCGKLNHSKGYDIFVDATKKLKNHKEFSDWKVISAGYESRRLIKKENYIKELGQISNKKVLEYYKKSKIAVAPSVWDEPLGRLPLEASAMGCLPITSSKGGLTETNLDGIVLKKNTSSELYKVLINLISNPAKLNKLNKKVLKNFRFTEKKFHNQIKKIRRKDNKKIKKIFIISNFNQKNKKRLFYSFFNKIKIGFQNSNFKLDLLSDRDFIRENRSFFDISGTKKFNLKILNKIKKFKPDLIILGHTDRININTLKKIFVINKNIKIIKIFIDSISKEFFQFDKVFYDYKFLDKIFVSSNPYILQKFDYHNKIKFIPYPVLKEVDYLRCFEYKIKDIDVFFALSHGQNRGSLKFGKKDERETFLKEIREKLPQNLKTLFVGVNGIQPVWGKDFYNLLKRSKISINLSRGHYKNYYSSDRISTLIGNGSFVLNEEINNYNKIFNKKELVNFKNAQDLIQKINYYLDNKSLRYRISKKSYIKYHNHINFKKFINYVFDIINNKNIKNKYIWS